MDKVEVRTQRFFLESSHAEPQIVFQLYELLYDAKPLPISAADLITASGYKEIAVNASLQFLHEQGWIEQTPDGKYLLTKPETRRPQLNFRLVMDRKKLADERLKTIIEYATSYTCRRAQILSYFGQNLIEPCSGCDVCDSEEPSAQSSVSLAEKIPLQATKQSDFIARIILQTTLDFSGRLGRSLVSGVLAASKRKKILELNLHQNKHYGALAMHRSDIVLQWIDNLIEQRLLETTAEEYPRLLITEHGRVALESDSLLALADFAAKKAATEASSSTSPDPPAYQNEAMNPEQAQFIASELKQWRLQKCQELVVSAYVILHNSALEEISRRIPKTRRELEEVKGIGERLTEKFGDEILAIVSNAVTEFETRQSDTETREPDEKAEAGNQPLDVWLQIEIWRQGGNAPSSTDLLNVLASSDMLERNKLIVLLNALSDLQIQEAAKPFLAMLEDTTDGNFLISLCEALAKLQAREAIAKFIELLGDARPGVRRAAIRALGRLRSHEATAKLQSLAEEDESDYIRLAARAALLRISKEEV